MVGAILIDFGNGLFSCVVGGCLKSPILLLCYSLFVSVLLFVTLLNLMNSACLSVTTYLLPLVILGRGFCIHPHILSSLVISLLLTRSVVTGIRR